MKESSYTNINEHKEKEQAQLLKDEKPKYYHEIPRKKDENENEKGLVTKEMALSNLGKTIFIGDSAATRVRKVGLRRETLAFCDWNQQNWDWRQSDRADMRSS